MPMTTTLKTPEHNPRMIPLLPRHKINLFCVDGDGDRFAALFRQTWRKLPLSAPRALLRHWRATTASLCHDGAG